MNQSHPKTRFGSTVRILHVDLTTSKIEIEELPDSIYRLYPGGKALAAYLLLKHLPPRTDPLGPDNVLVLANGLLTGAPISTAVRFTAAARSPLSGAYGESEAGGFWGPELKMAGFEAIVIHGRAPQPVYLWVQDSQAEIRPAAHLWGRPFPDVQAAVRQELDDAHIQVLQIGLAGENQVRFAALSHEMRHFNGRCGMGAVMGSKNLKAIAVRGHGRYTDLAQDPRALLELGRTLARQVRQHPQSWDMQVKGTPMITGGLNAAGMLPTRNFQEGVFAGTPNLDWEAYDKELLKGRGSCFACAVRCKREVGADGPYPVSAEYGGPEYEAMAGFGPNCGIDELTAVARANQLCNQYGLDTISTSNSIAFAMECFETGLIGLQDTGGLELRFGNAPAMLALVEQIATRQGFGDLLAEGVRRASQAIGKGAESLAMHVKGQELPMHDPRGKTGTGIGYAVCESGADHLVAYHDTLLANPDSLSFKGAAALGISQALPPRELSPRKAALYARLEDWSSAGKTLGLCYFGPTPRSFIQVGQVLQAVRAATGWQVEIEDLLKIGARGTVLARIFNLREGFKRQDDCLPERLFTPLPGGPLTGAALSHAEFEQALDALYTLKGWDPATCVPSRARLQELGIAWAAELLVPPAGEDTK